MSGSSLAQRRPIPVRACAGVTDATKAAMRAWISAFRQGGQRQSWLKSSGMIAGSSRHQQRRVSSPAPQSKRAPQLEHVLEVMRPRAGALEPKVPGQVFWLVDRPPAAAFPPLARQWLRWQPSSPLTAAGPRWTRTTLPSAGNEADRTAFAPRGQSLAAARPAFPLPGQEPQPRARALAESVAARAGLDEQRPATPAGPLTPQSVGEQGQRLAVEVLVVHA